MPRSDKRSDSALRRIGWTVWSIDLLLISLDIAANVPSTDGIGAFLNSIMFMLLGFSFASVGAFILRRSPRDRMAWFLLLVIGSALAVAALMNAYALQGLVNAPGSLPGAQEIAAANQGSWVLAIGSMAIFLVLLFPDGRLPSPRWRWLARVGATDIVAIAVIIALMPGKLGQGTGAGLENPLGLESLEGLLDVALLISIGVLPLCIVAAAVAMVRRFRRSRGSERLQLKWFAAAASLVAITYLIAMLGQLLKAEPFQGPDPGWLLLLQQLAGISFIALPIAIGTAILRHRLFDIDIVIKRTVVYASLTASLALVYFAVVLTLRSLSGMVTGDSQLAVAVSTLVVAALFRPLRRRIQTAVNHRFYRRAYDANLTLESFTDRLRQEVSLEAVSTDLRDVVDQTMQPEHLSLWLRRTEAR